MACLLCLFMSFADAQRIRVKVRPVRPTVVVKQTPSPGVGHVWIDEDWEPRGQAYGWKGGYWATPPRKGAIYVKGHWAKTRYGWEWVPGHWR